MKKFTQKLKKNFLVSLVTKLWKHPKGRLGLILVTALALMAIFAPLIAPYNPYDVTQRSEKGLSPSWEHPLGTTITTGQDIFSMLIYGSRVSMSIGIITGLCIALLGAFMGILAGYAIKKGKELDCATQIKLFSSIFMSLVGDSQI